MAYDSHWQSPSILDSLIKLFTIPIDLTLTTMVIHYNIRIFLHSCVLLFLIYKLCNNFYSQPNSFYGCICLHSRIGKSKQCKPIIRLSHIIRNFILSLITFSYIYLHTFGSASSFTLRACMGFLGDTYKNKHR